MVTAQYLLEGTAYALEQCGLLLRDAVILFNVQAYQSAVALTAFAREELGRARIIFDLRIRVVETGAKIDIKDIQDRCGDHVTKQEWAQLSFTVMANNDTQLGKLLRKMVARNPQTPEFRQADADLKKVIEQQRKHAPKARHDERLQALYVEPKATGWNRPIVQVTKESAYQSIYQAVNDYALFLSGNLESKFNQALQGWAAHPQFPDPQWPELL